jgi:hypothetical protein
MKGIQTTLEIYASLEENEEAVELLTRNARRIEAVLNSLEKRVGVLEREEPQYQGN